MIPITPEMIEQGAKVVGNIVNMGIDIFNKINAEKKAAKQELKDYADAVNNIIIGWSDAFAMNFNKVTTGSSEAPYLFIKAAYKYMADNPIVYASKAEKISGKKKYEIVFKDGLISLQKLDNSTVTVIMEKQFDKNAAIFTEGNIILPYNYAVEKANSQFDMDLYNRANEFVSGKKTLTQTEIAFWKDPKAAQNIQTTNNNTDNPANQQSQKKNIGLYVGIGAGGLILIGLLIFLSMPKKK